MIEDSLVFASPVSPPGAGAAYCDAVADALAFRRKTLDTALLELQVRAPVIGQIAAHLIETLCTGHKVLVAGNGGSAAEAQHFATELVGRFKRERSPYAVLALTADTALLTALGNDYGYAEIFARQVCGLGYTGDLLLVYSTSGESENLVRAVEAARSRGMLSVAVTGERHSRLEALADLTARMPLLDTPAVQELHMAITHILCDIVETELAARARKASNR